MSKQVTISGNLGRAPESKEVPIKKGPNAGKTRYVLKFSVVTTTSQKIENEGDSPPSYKVLFEEWCHCEYWLSNKEYAAHLINILQAGSPVLVSGVENCKKYKDKEGNDRIDRLVNVHDLYLRLTTRIEEYRLRPAKSNEEINSEEPVTDFDDDTPF